MFAPVVSIATGAAGTVTVNPGATLRVYADLLPASDGTAPFSIHTFNQITGGHTIFPRQAAVANDHFVFTGKQDDDKQTEIGRQFAAFHGIEKPYYATPGDGIFHFYFPEQGLVLPGQFIPGADSHSRAYGAYGAIGIGVVVDGQAEGVDKHYFDNHKQIVLSPDGFIYPEYDFLEYRMEETRIGTWRDEVRLSRISDFDKDFLLPECRSCEAVETCGLKYWYKKFAQEPKGNCRTFYRATLLAILHAQKLKQKPNFMKWIGV